MLQISSLCFDGSCLPLDSKNSSVHVISQVWMNEWTPCSSGKLQRWTLWLLWFNVFSVFLGKWLHDHQLFPIAIFFLFILILFHPTLLLPFSLKNVLFHKVSSSMIFLPRESPSVWEALSETLFSSPHYYTKDDYLTRAGDKNQSV